MNKVGRGSPVTLSWRQRQVLPAESFWSKDALRIFQALQEIPWVALTTISVSLGMAVLATYFRFIDHFPSDLAALTALAVTTTAVVVLLIFCAALSLFLPSIAAAQYVEASPAGTRTPFGRNELLFTQILGVSSFFAYVSYDLDCGSPDSWWFFVWLLLSVFAFAYVVQLYVRKNLSGTRVIRVVHTIFIALASLAPFIALVPWKPMISTDWIDASVFMMSAWLLLLAFNAAAIGHASGSSRLLLAGSLLTILLYVAVPLSMERPSPASALVAEAVGIKSSAPITALLDGKGCELMATARRHMLAEEPTIECDHQASNVMTVTVLSNVGSTWVLGVGPVDEGGLPTLRVSIPASSVHLARRTLPREKKGNSCLRRNSGNFNLR